VTDGQRVNSLLRRLYELQPGHEPCDSERQLTLLAIALCVACRGYGLSRKLALQGLAEAWDGSIDIPLVPIDPEDVVLQ
jgi:hypothetical protein